MSSYIVNGTGFDLSSRFTTLHHHETTPSTDLRKRAASTPINECPTRYSFLYSRCSRNHSPQAWSLICRAQAGALSGNTLTWGTCEPTELCVDGKPSADTDERGFVESTAWCVDQQNFIKISNLLANGEEAETVQMGFNAVAGTQYSVEAILTTLDSENLIKAQSMEIQAQRVDVIGNVQSWRTLNAGNQQCSNCASVGILDLPIGTQRIITHIELMPETVNGLLYLMSVG